MFASFMRIFPVMIGMMFFPLVDSVRCGGAFLCCSLLDLFFEFLAGCGDQLRRIQRSHAFFNKFMQFIKKSYHQMCVFGEWFPSEIMD